MIVECLAYFVWVLWRVIIGTTKLMYFVAMVIYGYSGLKFEEIGVGGREREEQLERGRIQTIVSIEWSV